MLTALAVVVYIIGLVLNVGGAYALAFWLQKRTTLSKQHATWKANGADPAQEPEDVPSFTAPAALLGFGLVALAVTVLFLFAYHLGAS